MKTQLLAARAVRWLAFCIFTLVLASAAPAGAEGRNSPWFGSDGGFKRIPMGKPPAAKREWRREAPFIRRLYRNFLNRAPSEDEVRYWVKKLGRDIGATEMVRVFMESDEFFLRQAYLGLLGREPDPVGLEGFTRELRNGASRADVVESILDSDEFARLMR